MSKSERELASFLEELDKRIARNSLEHFAIRYFSHYRKCETPEFHKEIFGLLQQGEQSRMVIAAPRGHAKSTIISLMYVLWVALTARKRFIVLLSDSSTQADLLLKSIRDELEDNELLISDYGPQAGAKWTESDVELVNGCKITAMGSGKKIRGRRSRDQRPDLIILDDIENDENVRSKDYRDKMTAWFNAAVYNAIDQECGQIIMIGTVLHKFSVLSKVLKNENWQRKIYKAIDENGNALWPAMFTPSKLAEIKANIGPHAFSREYLNNPVADDIATFNESWLRYYDKLPEKFSGVAIGCDPALGKTDSADYFAICAIGRTESDEYYLLAMERMHGTIDGYIDRLLHLVVKFHTDTVLVDSTAFQEIMRRNIEEKARKSDINIPIRGIKLHSDKQLRIEKLQPYFERGKIFIKKDMEYFIEEYCLYPSVEHDDQLDALEIAISGIGRRYAWGSA